VPFASIGKFVIHVKMVKIDVKNGQIFWNGGSTCIHKFPSNEVVSDI
jgi:hypothetical protein